MSKDKKYYWLKLKEDFFDDDTVKFIEEQDNGIAYGWFYLKLCLKSLKTNGILVRIVGEMFLPYDAESLAKLTDTPIDTARCALALLKKIGVISEQEGGKLFLPQLVEMVGKESESASRMRRLRASQCANIVQKCDGDVTPVLHLSDGNVRKSDTEIENRDEEIKKESIEPPIVPNKKFNPIEHFGFDRYSQEERSAIITFIETRKSKGNPVTEPELPSFRDDINGLKDDVTIDFIKTLKRSLAHKGSIVRVLKQVNSNENESKRRTNDQHTLPARKVKDW